MVEKSKNPLWLVLLALLSLTFNFNYCGGKGGGKEDADGTEQDVIDVQKDEVIVDIPVDDTLGDDVIEEQSMEDALGEDTISDPAEATDQIEVDGEEETTTSKCGNGTIDPEEVCDDGNTETEFCGGGDDCIADCSLLEERCGNSIPDDGEQCDDGDDNSMNECTTSCTINDNNIGSPCQCTGRRCSNTDFTAGNIIGCDNVEIPTGSGGVIGCLRSISEPISGTNTYFAEGYCTIMAVKCEGPDLCNLVPQPGNYDTMRCPPGYFMHEDVRTVMGVTVSTRSCLKICESDAECRWNAHDDFWNECGQYRCMSLPDSGPTKVCYDGRNLP